MPPSTRYLAHKIIKLIEKEAKDMPAGSLVSVGCVVLHILAKTANAPHEHVMKMYDGMRFLRQD